MDPFLARFRDPLVLALTVIALLGWLAVIVVLITGSRTSNELKAQLLDVQNSRDQVTAELQAQRQATGTIETLKQAIQAEDARLADLVVKTAEGIASLGSVSAELEGTTASLAVQSGELQTTETSLAQAEQRLTEVSGQITDIEASITERTNELTEVGERLEAARNDEATIRQTIADLSTEASSRSEDVADVEGRLQEARAAEADARNLLTEAQGVQDDLAARQSGLEETISALEERRDTLTDELRLAETQRSELQAQVTSLAAVLAERSDQLVLLEEDIKAAQAGTDDSQAAISSGVLPGLYVARLDSSDAVMLTALFRADGRFEMLEGLAIPGQNAAESLSGHYSVSGNELNLTDAIVEVGPAKFPMNCVIEPAATGFSVQVRDGDDGCTLEGLLFSRL